MKRTDRSPKHKPRVTIGLPVFNGEQYIEEALKSLLAQTFTDFELIISDNASTDRTAEICRAYAATDSRIRFYRSEQNVGLAQNCNRVVEEAVGEYFKWAHHDDRCAPDYIRRCVEVLDQMPSVVLCYADTIGIDENGKEVKKYLDESDVSSSYAPERFFNLLSTIALSNHVFGVIRTDKLRQTRLIGKYIASDVVLIAELALIGKFYRIPEYLLFRRDHPMKANRVNPSPKQLADWYSPDNKGKIPLVEWRLFVEHLRSIRRVRMPVSEKAACYMYMARRLRWKRNRIAAEFALRLKQTLRFSRSSAVASARPVDNIRLVK